MNSILFIGLIFTLTSNTFSSGYVYENDLHLKIIERHPYRHEFLHYSPPFFLTETSFYAKNKKNEDPVILDELNTKLSTDKSITETYYYEEIKNVKYTKPEDDKIDRGNINKNEDNTNSKDMKVIYGPEFIEDTSKKMRRDVIEDGIIAEDESKAYEDLLTRLLQIKRNEEIDGLKTVASTQSSDVENPGLNSHQSSSNFTTNPNSSFPISDQFSNHSSFNTTAPNDIHCAINKSNSSTSNQSYSNVTTNSNFDLNKSNKSSTTNNDINYLSANTETTPIVPEADSLVTPSSIAYVVDIDVIDIITNDARYYENLPLDSDAIIHQHEQEQNVEDCDNWRRLHKRDVSDVDDTNVDVSNFDEFNVESTNIDDSIIDATVIDATNFDPTGDVLEDNVDKNFDDVLRLSPAASSIVFRPLFAYRASRN